MIIGVAHDGIPGVCQVGIGPGDERPGRPGEDVANRIADGFQPF